MIIDDDNVCLERGSCFSVVVILPLNWFSIKTLYNYRIVLMINYKSFDFGSIP